MRAKRFAAKKDPGGDKPGVSEKGLGHIQESLRPQRASARSSGTGRAAL